MVNSNIAILELPKGNFINYIATEVSEIPSFMSNDPKYRNKIIMFGEKNNKNLTQWSKNLGKIIRHLEKQNVTNANLANMNYYKGMINRYRTLRNTRVVNNLYTSRTVAPNKYKKKNVSPTKNKKKTSWLKKLFTKR